MKEKKLIIIEGPTAVGKTTYAIDLAKRRGTEIISADSRQFYKELKIGVARPSEEELSAVPHHFIAHLSINTYYSVSSYEQEVLSLLENLFLQYDEVIMVGGSGLYVQAVVQGIDDLPDPSPELRESLKTLYQNQGIEALRENLKKLDPTYYAQVDLCNPKRLLRALEVCISTSRPFSSLRTQKIKNRSFEIERRVINRPKEILHERINQRVDLMLEQGLLEEVKQLFPFQDLNALNTVGYKEFFPFLEGKISYEQAVEDVKTHSRRYAKRQLTWLRKQNIDTWIYLE